ncbi:hypothetical protein ACX0G9_30990 [Flavitalea flava]
MGKGIPFEKPWLNADKWVNFQIGQCRLHIQIERTKEFYAAQPKISTNCSCDNCKYFENEVINHSNRLFEVLKEMGVDLSRQPNINSDGICCVGDTKPDKLGYMGNYFVYGKIGKTSKKNKKSEDDNRVSEVTFNDAEFGHNTQATIRQFEEDKLSFGFYMDVDKFDKI